MQSKIYELFGQYVQEVYLQHKWNAVYTYLSEHTVQETKDYFGEGIIKLVLDYVKGV